MSRKTLRQRGKRLASFVLIASMMLPTGICGSTVSVEAKILDSNIERKMIGSTVFESSDEFEEESISKSDLKYALEQARNPADVGYIADLETSECVRWAEEKLENAIVYAQTIYDDETSSDAQIKDAYQKIEEVYDIEERVLHFYKASHIEAESFDNKSEMIVNDGNNIGSVKRNTWVAYNSVCFNSIYGSTEQIDQVTIHYAAQQSDAGGYAEIYLDDKSGVAIGRIDLPTTGEDWSNYQSVTAKLNTGIVGIHNLYIVFKNDGSHEYVSNVDWIEFTSENGGNEGEGSGGIYIIIFDSDGGIQISNQFVAEGNTVKKPETPVKEGYIFKGWYLGDDAYDFNAEVVGDITLIAMWEENGSGKGDQDPTTEEGIGDQNPTMEEPTGDQNSTTEGPTGVQNSTTEEGTSGNNNGGTTEQNGTVSDDKFKVGFTFEKGKLAYKITNVKTSEVEVLKPVTKTHSSVSIPKTVTFNGKQFKVTSIAKNAFKNYKKLKKVTIGKNVIKIGSKAFYNCKMLKKVTFKKNKLKSVGKGAFLKTAKNLRIRTGSKSNLTKYKKLFKKKIPTGTKVVY